MQSLLAYWMGGATAGPAPTGPTIFDLHIDGLDVDYLFKSLQITEGLNGTIGTASFKIRPTLGLIHWFTPNAEIMAKSVEIRQSVTNALLFAGTISKMEPTRLQVPADMVYTCSCQDYTTLLDTAVVLGDVYTNETDANILIDLLATYCPDISADFVSTVATIAGISFDYITMREAISKLAECSGAVWYVDANKKLHYYDPTTNPASFSLSDVPDYVTSFPYRLNPPYTVDFSTPANRVTVIGAPGITATYMDYTSLSTYLLKERTVVDRSIQTVADALLRAQVEVAAYAWPRKSGSITFWQDGLDVGQNLTIVCASHAINDTFLMRSLSMKELSKTQIEYTTEFGEYRPDLVRMIWALNSRLRQTL